MDHFVICVQTIRDFPHIQAVTPHNIVTGSEWVGFVQFPCHDVINCSCMLDFPIERKVVKFDFVIGQISTSVTHSVIIDGVTKRFHNYAVGSGRRFLDARRYIRGNSQDHFVLFNQFGARGKLLQTFVQRIIVTEVYCKTGNGEDNHDNDNPAFEYFCGCPHKETATAPEK